LQRSDLARWAVVPMRILVGCGFIEHGFAKLSRGHDAFGGILQPRRANAASSGVVDNRHGTRRRLGIIARSFRGLGEHSHGGSFTGRDAQLERGVQVSEIRHRTPIGAWDDNFAPGSTPRAEIMPASHTTPIRMPTSGYYKSGATTRAGKNTRTR